LQAAHHAAEVLADEGREQLRAGEALIDVVAFEDFVGELGAGSKGQFFGEDKGVVTVEEELCDLEYTMLVR